MKKDADVLLHAICDAMFGAAALGDIGAHYPDNDGKYDGIDSRLLLKSTNEHIREKGYRVINIDATVIAQAPKLSPYIEKMVENIADTLKLKKDSINVKATTEEQLGFTGSGQGIAAHAVCLITEE